MGWPWTVRRHRRTRATSHRLSADVFLPREQRPPEDMEYRAALARSLHSPTAVLRTVPAPPWILIPNGTDRNPLLTPLADARTDPRLRERIHTERQKGRRA